MALERVVLVCAPFFSVVRPAIGVSLLKAGLEAAGISTRVDYLNVRFADRVGVDIHESAATGVANTTLLGEWIFAPAVNRGAIPADDERYARTLRELYSDEHRGRLHALRDEAAAFVEDEAQRLAAEGPAILGFSSLFQQNCASIGIAQRVRELNPSITICFGGANCEGPMGRALLAAFPAIDCVFSGEADATFPEFVRNLLAGTMPYTTSPSVFARDARYARAAADACETPIANLDELPVPDFVDYFAALDRSPWRERIRPGLVFESSRGCWWGAKKHCRFCGLNGSAMAYRAKSPQRVIAELDELARTWCTTQFLAVDNIMHMKHVESVFGPLAERAPEYRFFYEIKANLKRAHLEQIARGGVRWVQPGIESLHDELLRSMEKGVSALQNVCLLRDCAELGMRATWTILFGFPGERADQYDRMAAIVPLLEHLDPPYGCVPIRLDRFSPYFERAAELGFEDVRPMPAYGGIYALDADVLAGLAYYFEGTAAARPARGHTAALEAEIHRWARRFRRGAERPVLAATDTEIGTLIEDTRSCAVQRWRYVSGDERAVLNAFREPAKVGERSEAFERLAALGYLLLDGERALSLVVEPHELAAQRPVDAEFPGGALLPPLVRA